MPALYEPTCPSYSVRIIDAISREPTKGSPLEIHHFLETRHRLTHLSMRENPIHDLVLKCETLHLAHGVGVLLIGAFQGGGIAVRAHHFVQSFVGALRIQHEFFAANDVVE